ncbi:MAG: PQQ-binding-like beta-propeller repeat protein [Acidobacteriota bacterium]|nr:PQQ-binding-like beta-propeller repeat protein [Acidobacteriota bacterium]
MRTILFGNHQNYNSLLRTAFQWLAVIILLASVSLETGAQEHSWESPLKRCWSFSNPNPSRNSPASDNEKIFIPTSTGTIIALDQRTGSLAWQADLGGNLETNVMFYKGQLFASAIFGNGSDGVTRALLRKINPETGIPFWQYEGSKAPVFFAERNFQGMPLTMHREGGIVRLDSNGKSVWSKEIDAQITTPVAKTGTKLVFGTANKTIVIMDYGNDDELAQVNLSGVPASIVVSDRGIIFTADGSGNVYALDTDTQRIIWKTKTGAGISKLSIFGRDVIVSSKDNFVYRVSGLNGKKIWKRKLAGRVLGSVFLDDTHAVFVTSGASTALLIDLENGNLTNKIDLGEPFASGPVRIAGGFAVPTSSAITAVTPNDCATKKTA